MNKIRIIAFSLSLIPFSAQAELNFVSVFLSDNLYTHTTPTLTVPVSDIQSIKYAKVYWLPEYQAKMAARDSNSNGGNDGSRSCSQYGLVPACSYPKISTGFINPIPQLTCQKGCICTDGFKYDNSNCDQNKGWKLTNSFCDGKADGCYAVPCADGFVAGLNDCSLKTNPQGWNYSTSGFAGGQACGKCTPKTCNGGYTSGINNCSGQSYPEGWTYQKDGAVPYAGDSPCGRCVAKSCPSGFMAGTSTCSNEGWIYGSNGYAGNSVCGRCSAKNCANEFTAGLTDCNSQTVPSGWNFTTNGKSGDQVCGKCSAKDCASGYTASLNNCNGQPIPAYWRHESRGYHGNDICGKCTELNCEEKNALCSGGSWNLDYYYLNSALRCLIK